MPFRFAYLCDLLSRLEQPYLRQAPLLPNYFREYTQTETLRWFQRHKDELNANDTNQQAVISMLRPECWVDREFGWDAEKLEPMIARVFQCTRLECTELHKWKTFPHTGDLAAHLGRVLASRENVSNHHISIL